MPTNAPMGKSRRARDVELSEELGITKIFHFYFEKILVLRMRKSVEHC